QERPLCHQLSNKLIKQKNNTVFSKVIPVTRGFMPENICVSAASIKRSWRTPLIHKRIASGVPIKDNSEYIGLIYGFFCGSQTARIRHISRRNIDGIRCINRLPEIDGLIICKTEKTIMIRVSKSHHFHLETSGRIKI